MRYLARDRFHVGLETAFDAHHGGLSGRQQPDFTVMIERAPPFPSRPPPPFQPCAAFSSPLPPSQSPSPSLQSWFPQPQSTTPSPSSSSLVAAVFLRIDRPLANVYRLFHGDRTNLRITRSLFLIASLEHGSETNFGEGHTAAVGHNIRDVSAPSRGVGAAKAPTVAATSKRPAVTPSCTGGLTFAHK